MAFSPRTTAVGCQGGIKAGKLLTINSIKKTFCIKQKEYTGSKICLFPIVSTEKNDTIFFYAQHLLYWWVAIHVTVVQAGVHWGAWFSALRRRCLNEFEMLFLLFSGDCQSLSLHSGWVTLPIVKWLHEDDTIARSKFGWLPFLCCWQRSPTTNTTNTKQACVRLADFREARKWHIALLGQLFSVSFYSVPRVGAFILVPVLHRAYEILKVTMFYAPYLEFPSRSRVRRHSELCSIIIQCADYT